MSKRYITDKPKWKRGDQMPKFSGKKWSELEDIWPKEVRVNDDVYKILGLFYPAWVKTYKFVNETMGFKLKTRDFFMLCWLHRVQDAKEGMAFQSYPALKGMNISGRLWYSRKAEITKFGLIENLPLNNHRAYQVTELGKIVIKKFLESLQEIRDNLANSMDDEYNVHQLSDFLGLDRETELKRGGHKRKEPSSS